MAGAMEKGGSLFKFNQVLLLGFLLFGGLYLGQKYLIPIFIASLISMLLLPICEKLEQWGWKRVFAIIACIMIFLAVLIGISLLIANQIAGFSEDFPDLRKKLQENISNFKEFLAVNTAFTMEQLQQQMEDGSNQVMDSIGSYIQSALTVTTGIMINFFLILIYIGFFLAYRERIEKFIIKLTPKEEEEKSEQIIKKCTSMSVAYLSGILTVMTILAICNSIALNLLGIEHALFFAILAAILNLLPFIGSFLGSILPMIMALLTKDEIWYVVAIGIYFTVIQYIESYFLTPFIVGGKVKVNPLAEILALVLGGVIWGIPGLVLFIPLIGLVKVLFDHVEKLEPFGYVIGRDYESSADSIPNKIKSFFQRIFKKEK
jgi:AI-2 transport protein TqsA